MNYTFLVNSLKSQYWNYIFSIIISLIIISDFVLPGKEYIEKIIRIDKESQLNYSVSEGAHFTYKIVTKENTFYVSRQFGTSVNPGNTVCYTQSQLFKKVNSYSINGASFKEVYTLRQATGFYLPLLVLVIMLAAFKFPWLQVATFIMHILVILDVIYLIT